MKWIVRYSAERRGPFEWVADEYAETFEDVRHAILYDYSDEETPIGWYKIEQEGAGMGQVIRKTALTEAWSW